MAKLNSSAAVGIDLGGTKTEVILLGQDGEVCFLDRAPTPSDDGYEAILATVAEMIDRATSQLPSRTPVTVEIGIPGFLDENTGRVMY